MIAAGIPLRGYPPTGSGHATHLYWHPVPGQLVFITALLLIVFVAVGWYVIASKCKKCDG